MTHPIRFDRRAAVALAISLLALAAGFRLLRATFLPELPNFSPMLALAVTGAFVLPGALAFLVPLGALILSDLALNLHYGFAPFGWGELIRYACYGLGVATGLGLRRFHAGLPAALLAVLGNALFFYLVSNTAAWLGSPAYAQSFAGWIQALTVGLPGFPPTWTFLRNSLLSDLGFAVAFLLLTRRLTTPGALPAFAAARNAV